jgi:iron complex outermembrane receptor protein
LLHRASVIESGDRDIVAHRLAKGNSMAVRYSFGRLVPFIVGSMLGTVAPAFAQNLPVSIDARDPNGFRTREEEDGAIIVTASGYVPSGAITASKTTAPLIETPQSVSVVTRDQIDLLNFIDVQQAVRYTAGIVGENYGPDLRFDFLTLRGFIPVQFIDGLQAPISSTIVNVGVDLYGFDAVDILKGPAASLYGSSPPGGIYNLTSRRPDARAGGEIQLKYGTQDFKQAAGTITGELTDGVSARLTGLYRDRDSQTDLVTAKRAYIAPAVSWQIGPDTQITGLGHYQHDRVEGDTNGFLPALGVLFPNPVGKVRRDINLGEPDYNFYRRNQWGAGYELTHRFSDRLRFTQNARWGKYHEYQQVIYPTGLGADNRTVSRANFPSSEDTRQFAIDSRFNAAIRTGALEHDLLAGFDYRNYRNEAAFSFVTAGVPTIDLFNPVYSSAPIAAPALGLPYLDRRLKQSGAYVQDRIKFGGFIATLTGRQDWVSDTSYTSATPTTTKPDKFTWRAGLTYVTEAGIAPYVSYATSFQPISGATYTGTPFVPTAGKQWEGGVKYDARGLGSDVRLFATAAVFRIEQTNVITTDPAAGTGIVPATAQVQTGEAISKGIELELVTRVQEKLSVNLAYSYTDAKISRSNIPAEVNARLAAQPRHKASMFVDYTHDRGVLAGFGVGAGVRYLSETPGNLPSAFVPLVYTSPATTLFDGTLHYDVPGWRFAVNGSNLFDKRFAGRCSGPTGCFFGQARQVIGTVTKKF